MISLLAAAFTLLTASFLTAADYTVSFDATAPHSLTGRITNSSYRTFVNWGSSYTVNSGKYGSRLTNSSSYQLTSIHIRNSSGTFIIPATAAGGQFTEIWRKNDGKEVIFNGGRIPTYSTIWMLVSPKSPSNPDASLTGMFSDEAIRPSNPEEWTKVFPSGIDKSKSDAWRRMLSACPATLRDIRLYGVSPDGKKYLLITRDDEYLWYDDQTKSMHALELPATIVVDVNSIAVTIRDNKSAFVISKDGIEQASVSIDQPSLGLLLGKSSTKE